MTVLEATADPTNAKVDLYLEWAVGDASIVRIEPDGSRYAVIGTEPVMVTGGLWGGADYMAPLDVEVTYEATSGDDVAVLTSDPVTVDSDESAWLKHPTDTALNMRISLAEAPERDRRLNVTVLPVLGRTHPLAVSDGRRNAATSELTLRTSTLAEAVNMRALMDDGSPLLLQGPAAWDVGSVWIQPMEFKEKWLVRYMPDAKRVWTLSYAEVGQPTALALTGIIGDWGALLSTYNTWSDVRFANGTWEDLMQNT